jgi:hypothetical protein
MNIILRTFVEPQNSDKKEVAISFDTEALVKIIKESGLEKGNEALDSLVNKYMLDVKKIISEVINK